MSQALYRNFRNQAELDAEYNVERSVSDFPAVVARFEAASRKAVAELRPRLTVPYGPTRVEHLDIYPSVPTAAAGAPVLVFFHGGYWRALSSQDFAFVALGLAPLGVAVVNVNYALCPGVTLDEIVRQARAAVVWSHRHVAEYGGDPQRIHVGGHSAGAQLSAMCLLTDWVADYGRPPDIIKGAALIGGLYDLRPLPFTFVQPALQLDYRQVRRNSPGLLARKVPGETLIAYGGRETSEFQRQSVDFAAAWGAAGNRIRQVLVQTDDDHFASILALSDSASSLALSVRHLMGVPPAASLRLS